MTGTPQDDAIEGAFFANLPQPVLVLAEDATIIRANTAFQDWFKRDIRGSSFLALLADKTAFVGPFNEVLRKNASAVKLLAIPDFANMGHVNAQLFALDECHVALVFEPKEIEPHKETFSQQFNRILLQALEAIPEGFVIYDRHDRLVLCNGAYKRIYHLSAPSMVPGAPFRDILQYGLEHGQYIEAGETPEDQAAWLERRLAKHRQNKGALIQQLSENQWLQIEEKVTSEGYVVGIRADSSSLKLTEKKLEQLNSLLQSRNDALDQFAAIVAHDMQAPLRQISVLCELVQEAVQQGDLPGVENKVARIAARSLRMRTLIQSLLQYSRIAFADVSLRPIPFKTIITEALDALENELRLSEAKIEVTGEETIICCEPEVFALLMQNLVSNAVKYRPEGQSPEIRILVSRHGDTVVITVSDKGIGIEPKYAERIFNIFERLHGERSAYEGTGLGLALSRQIVEAHKGKIYLDTSYQAGARFVIELFDNCKGQPLSTN